MIEKQYRMESGKPYPLGIYREGDCIQAAFASAEKDCGMIIYSKKDRRELCRIPFSETEQTGNIYSMKITGFHPDEVCYQLYEQNKIVRDFYAKAYEGHEKYGETAKQEEIYYTFPNDAYNWEGDVNPRIPYENSIMYCMHVRGFTKHASSKVSGRGTYQGITAKIPYLKDLGITAIELLPAYEFYEKEFVINSGKDFKFSPLTTEEPEESALNYWGYTKGSYYALKNSYAAGRDASEEFRNLVKELHKNHMEVIMQFYFTEETAQHEIMDILHYWVIHYHIDGFHLKGTQLPIAAIEKDPGLVHTKIMSSDYQIEETERQEGMPVWRNMASYKDDFRYHMRNFLKGDEDMLSGVLFHMKRNPHAYGKINYFTNYDGFTLMDLVSYDRKHNEENGEDNRDGCDYNHSWNCGTEGKSRKKSIMALRLKQMKNAMTMLFTAQGTPLIYMGDEFGNSQNGNNNPYCQDNSTSWLNWKDLDTNRELYTFIRSLIALRKAHPVWHQPAEMRNLDYLSCGYPDLSFHGTQVWRPAMEHYCRHIALMYCGKYAKTEDGEEDNFFYLAMNMHWEPHEFSFPNLPDGMKWYLSVSTDGTLPDDNSPAGQSIEIPARTIQIYMGRQEEK